MLNELVVNTQYIIPAIICIAMIILFGSRALFDSENEFSATMMTIALFLLIIFTLCMGAPIDTTN